MTDEDAYVISLSGEYDIGNCVMLEKSLAPALEHPLVIIDFSQVTYIDSTALTRFVLLRNERDALGFGRCAFAALQPQIERIFQVVGFLNVWPSFESVEAARRSFAKQV